MHINKLTKNVVLILIYISEDETNQLYHYYIVDYTCIDLIVDKSILNIQSIPGSIEKKSQVLIFQMYSNLLITFGNLNPSTSLVI